MPEVVRVPSGYGEISVIVDGAPRGTPILFLHGIGSSARSFRLQLPYFSGSYRCLAWNAPGYGTSELVASMSMDDYAAAAVEVIDHEGLGAAHVVGVSWGSVIAARLALRSPDKVRSVTLASSSPGSAPSTGRYDNMLARREMMRESGPVALFDSRSQALFADRPVPPDLRDAVRSVATEDVHRDGYVSAADSMLATDHSDELENLVAPTLLVCGGEDVVTPEARTRHLASRIPGSEVRIIEGAGHLVNQEDPGGFNAVVDRFLREHP